jgi:TonB family protein
MVRLAPYLVEAVCELARALKDKTHAQTEISGLLFGRAQEGTLVVEALKTFKDSSGPRSDLARRERMEKAFTVAMMLANEDPEFAAYKLLGWFSLRGGGGLINSDVEFHNRHFKNSEDIGLIVWREGETQITTELYAAVESSRLTTEDYRWSSVRLSTELRHVSQPLDLVMRMRMNDDLYLRTYSVSEGRERRQEWKKIADNAKRAILSLLPGRHSDDVYPEDLPLPPPSGTATRSFESRTLFRGSDTEPSSSAPAPSASRAVPTPPTATGTAVEAIVPYDVNRAPRPKPAPEISGLPVLIPKRRPKSGLPWLSTALVFIVFSGLTFAFLAVKSAGGSDGKISQVMKILFPGSDVELRAASHGDSLWISWNRRNPVVAASNGAVLAVSDGPRHFERKLDASQVADGEVKYTPVSGDVTFELRVYGADQSMALGRLRVVDATMPVPSDNKPALDLSNSPPTGSSPVESTIPLPAAPANQIVSPTTAPMQAHTNNAAQPVTAASKKANHPALIPPLPITVENPANKPAEHPAQQPAQTARQSVPVIPPQVTTPKTAASRPLPASSNNVTTPLTSNTSISGWDPNLPENKPAAPTPQTQQPAAPPDSKTLDFIGPKVLLQVMPDRHSLTPGLISEVTRVEVEVRIDTNGHVKAAHLTNPNVKGQLGSAATTAAKQWTFQPATLRGQHVESDHTIVFEFRPEGQ